MSRSWRQRVLMMSRIGIQTNLSFAVRVQRAESFAGMNLNFVFASDLAAVSLDQADST